jgi:hypothetical protein
MNVTFSRDDSRACQLLVAMDAVILGAKRLDDAYASSAACWFAAFAL